MRFAEMTTVLLAVYIRAPDFGKLVYGCRHLGRAQVVGLQFAWRLERRHHGFDNCPYEHVASEVFNTVLELATSRRLYPKQPLPYQSKSGRGRL